MFGWRRDHPNPVTIPIRNRGSQSRIRKRIGVKLSLSITKEWILYLLIELKCGVTIFTNKCFMKLFTCVNIRWIHRNIFFFYKVFDVLLEYLTDNTRAEFLLAGGATITNFQIFIKRFGNERSPSNSLASLQSICFLTWQNRRNCELPKLVSAFWNLRNGWKENCIFQQNNDPKHTAHKSTALKEVTWPTENNCLKFSEAFIS